MHALLLVCFTSSDGGTASGRRRGLPTLMHTQMAGEVVMLISTSPDQSFIQQGKVRQLGGSSWNGRSWPPKLRRLLISYLATISTRPFVRLHRIDENASGEVTPLLAYLRELQRRHHDAVLVVHHAKKGAGRARAGKALRGSSEFHAWGDSNLYLREGDVFTLTVEHRAAPSQKPMRIEVVEAGEALALHIADRSDPTPPTPRSLDERIASALADAAARLPSGSCPCPYRYPL